MARRTSLYGTGLHGRPGIVWEFIISPEFVTDTPRDGRKQLGFG
jgi:hypothetical protein